MNGKTDVPLAGLLEKVSLLLLWVCAGLAIVFLAGSVWQMAEYPPLPYHAEAQP